MGHDSTLIQKQSSAHKRGMLQLSQSLTLLTIIVPERPSKKSRHEQHDVSSVHSPNIEDTSFFKEEETVTSTPTKPEPSASYGSANNGKSSSMSEQIHVKQEQEIPETRDTSYANRLARRQSEIGNLFETNTSKKMESGTSSALHLESQDVSLGESSTKMNIDTSSPWFLGVHLQEVKMTKSHLSQSPILRVQQASMVCPREI